MGFFAAEVALGAWTFWPEGFFAAIVAEVPAAVAAFLAPAAALVGRTIIVPQEVLEVVVLELT